MPASLKVNVPAEVYYPKPQEIREPEGIVTIPAKQMLLKGDLDLSGFGLHVNGESISAGKVAAELKVDVPALDVHATPSDEIIITEK